jgi:hypothetical protein
MSPTYSWLSATGEPAHNVPHPAHFNNIQAAVNAASDASDRHGMQQSSSGGGPWSKNHNFYLRYSTQKKSPSTIHHFRN